MTGYYKVADFVFAVTLSRDCDLDALLPSFIPFRCGERQDEELLFTFLEDDVAEECPDAKFLEEDDNDMGRTRLYRTGNGYRITLNYTEPTHVFEASPDFGRVSASVKWQDAYASLALCSMLRIAFAQAVLLHSAVSMHSSVVVHGGRAFMFMGRSGTGKSTHSRLWLEHVPDTRLLNDDNPIVRIVDGEAFVHRNRFKPEFNNFGDSTAISPQTADQFKILRKRKLQPHLWDVVDCNDLRNNSTERGNLRYDV